MDTEGGYEDRLVRERLVGPELQGKYLPSQVKLVRAVPCCAGGRQKQGCLLCLL